MPCAVARDLGGTAHRIVACSISCPDAGGVSSAHFLNFICVHCQNSIMLQK